MSQTSLAIPAESKDTAVPKIYRGSFVDQLVALRKTEKLFAADAVGRVGFIPEEQKLRVLGVSDNPRFLLRDFKVLGLVTYTANFFDDKKYADMISDTSVYPIIEQYPKNYRFCAVVENPYRSDGLAKIMLFIPHAARENENPYAVYTLGPRSAMEEMGINKVAATYVKQSEALMEALYLMSEGNSWGKPLELLRKGRALSQLTADI